ncbi:MAG TPA: hypothetical protein VFE17_06890 [Candidatus Baltobacteraceae bacterium]|jgi:hypothetical protein|nr:hypothetical protein [Candidatus Baltobacteraceae bacterium]
MKYTILRGAGFALALALAGAPAVSHAATAYTTGTQPVRVNYSTSISPLFGLGYPWSGTLQLTLNPDGIINGYYRPADNQEFIPVTGGRDGRNVWLDIGQMGRLHVTGTLDNGRITGTALNERTNEQFKFNANMN